MRVNETGMAALKLFTAPAGKLDKEGISALIAAFHRVVEDFNSPPTLGKASPEAVLSALKTELIAMKADRMNSFIASPSKKGIMGLAFVTNALANIQLVQKSLRH